MIPIIEIERMINMAKKVDLSKPEYEDLQQVAGSDIAKIVLNFCDSYCSKEIDDQWSKLRIKIHEARDDFDSDYERRYESLNTRMDDLRSEYRNLIKVIFILALVNSGLLLGLIIALCIGG